MQLDPLPLAKEPTGQVLPSGLDLRHMLGRHQPLGVPLARRALSAEVHGMRFVRR